MDYKIINLDSIHQSMMGNDEMIKQLVELYIIQSPTDFNALRDAVQAENKEQIHEKAHHIKPTMQYIGANSLMSEFETLEKMCKQDSTIKEIQEVFDKIQPRFMLMLDELETLAKKY